MAEYTIRPVASEDVEVLADMFISHITAHAEYISHGEMQMGVATGPDPCVPVNDARERWIAYMNSHLDDTESSDVCKMVDEDGGIAGFCVAEIQSDEGCEYGMVCDVLVDEDVRGFGIGGALLQHAIDWLKSKGIRDIYLESGRNNVDAHKFFEKRGFVHVSEIYKLKTS